MDAIEILIFIFVFAGLMLLFLGSYFYTGFRKTQRELVRRISLIGEESRSKENPGFLSAMRKRWLDRIQALGALIIPKREKELSHLRKNFLRAGYRGKNTPTIFWGFKGLFALLLAGGFLFSKLFIFRTMTSAQSMFFSILFALTGFYLPSLWLRIRISDRKERIQRGLPDALDLMVVCVEAGTGLDAAINRVAEEMKLSNKVISEEFKLLNLELRAGKQRRDALKNLAMRADLEDVNSLVTLLIQTERFGTSIGQALRVHSDSMRTKRFQRAEEIAQKMPVKLIFPLFLFIFPALLVVVLGPAVIKIFRTLVQAAG